MNILVTGGASGLGLAITYKLAAQTDNTVFFTYSSSAKEATALEGKLPNVKGIQCNFKELHQVEALKALIPKLNLDVLVNNAYTGEFLKTNFHKLDINDFLADFNDNLIPTVMITQEVLSVFRKKKSGKIITILTAALRNKPPLGSAIYVANKAYLEKLTKVWAAEYGKFNISSNTVSPAFMQTQLTSTMDERIIEQMIIDHPLKRLLMVEEVADAVFYLSTASPQVNGVDITLNAGTDL